MSDHRPMASVSLDVDNLWSYLKTHGNPAWEGRPGYLGALGPRLHIMDSDPDVRLGRVSPCCTSLRIRNESEEKLKTH